MKKTRIVFGSYGPDAVLIRATSVSVLETYQCERNEGGRERERERGMARK